MSSGKISSILFEKTGESLLIAGTHSEEFSESLESISSEKLVELADIVISEVEKKIPVGFNLEKTIFAVPVDWVEEGKIVKDYLLKLKSLCESLNLTPIGFIVSVEAITAYLQKKEGAPVTAILVELSHKHVTVSIAKNGVILSSKTNPISETAVSAVEHILSEQEDLEVLPSKIILINYEHAKKSQQAFLSHNWSKRLQFLHIPQVEVLDPEIEAQSVVSGVAFEMGFMNLTSVKIPSESSEKPVEVATVEESETLEEAEDKTEGELKEGIETKKEVDEEEIEDKSKDVLSEELVFRGEEVGFFQGVDVLHEKEEVKELEAEQDEVLHIEGEDERASTVSRMKLPSIGIPSVRIPKFLFGRGVGKHTVLYPILAVVLLLLVIVGYYYFFEKVSVTLYLEKKTFSKDLEVTFSPDGNTSASDKTVHIDVTSSQAEGDSSTETTGKKETGDKAKGEISVYNKTEDPKTFSKGSTIIGPNSLEFNLTGDVQIASTSSFSTSFSSSKVKVEASKFGKEYNLPSSSNFQMKGISTSDVFAKNESAFSGGTKKETQVVSADDIDTLTSKIIDDLSKKANESASKDASQKVLSIPVDYSFDEKTFSKKEGEEASAVSLSAKVTFKFGSYKISDLENLAKELDKSEVPEGYQYSSNNSKITVSDVSKNKNGEITGKINLSSVYLPVISTSDIITKLNGKNASKVDEVIRVKGVNDDLVNFTRSLPLFPKIFPFNKKNIEVNVSIQ